SNCRQRPSRPRPGPGMARHRHAMIKPCQYDSEPGAAMLEKRADPSSSVATPMDDAWPLSGGCGCGDIRFQGKHHPLIVHCCHCRCCQRASGAPFALNAVIESARVVHEGAEPELVDTPSASGKGQQIARC